MRDPQQRPAFIDILVPAEDRVRKLDLVEISTLAVPEGKKYVVAFALESRSYDKDVNFTMGGGLFNNADIFRRFYPNWTCRVYMDEEADPEVSKGIKISLMNDGVEVLPLPTLKNGRKMHAAIARHVVAADPTVTTTSSATSTSTAYHHLFLIVHHSSFLPYLTAIPT